MGFRRVSKKFIRFLIPTIVVLAILPLSLGEIFFSKKNPFSGSELRCVMALEEVETPRLGYVTGFNYECLKLFAKNNKATTSISIEEKGADYADSLRSGAIDILVRPYSGEAPGEGLVSLAPVDSTAEWVMKDNDERRRSMELWIGRFKNDHEYQKLHDRFFACFNPYRKERARNVLTPYDDLLKEYSGKIGWDWRLLAAIVWHESKFMINTVSPRGARGLMQVIPSTAKRLGYSDLLDPKVNIECGVTLLSRIKQGLEIEGLGHEEEIKYMLAAFNAGPGRILRQIDSARTMGLDVRTWENVAPLLPRETSTYVRLVLGRYDIFRGAEPEDSRRGRQIELEEEMKEAERDSLGGAPESFGPDSLGRIDLGDEEARDEEEKDNHEVRDSVGHENQR